MRSFFRRLIILIFILSVCAAAFAADIDIDDIDGAGEPEEVKLLAATARNALVYETVSGQMLFEKDIHDPVPIASLTKIMTTLLTLERGDLDDTVTAGADILYDITSDGSTQNIAPGEIMSIRDVMFCAMVASANEACNVLAEHIAGSIPDFIRDMNIRAYELGCRNTNFANTHGLPNDDHYSSAYDLLLIINEAMKHPFFMEIVNTTAKTVPPTNKTATERSFFTTNHLISKNRDPGYAYHLAHGIKTGYTMKAGYCLASSAAHDGMQIITVVLGAARENDITMSFVETKELMEWAFDSFSYRRILNSTEIIDTVKVDLGKDFSELYVVPQTQLTVLLPKDLDIDDIERLVTLPDAVEAPVTKGQRMGEITLAYNGHEYGVVPLISGIAVERSQEESLIRDVQEIVSNPWLQYAIFAAVGVIALYIVFVVIYNSRRRAANVRGNYKGKKRRRW